MYDTATGEKAVVAEGYVDSTYGYGDVDGKAVYASNAELKEIRSCFGLVFQNFNLFPQYTALENVTLAPSLLKKDPGAIRQRAMALLEQVSHILYQRIF